MNFKKALIWVICFQITFPPAAYARGDDGPDFDFSDEPFVVTPGEDRHEGRNDGNCTGSGCGERGGRDERSDDDDQGSSERGGDARGSRDDARGNLEEYDRIDWQPYGEPAVSDRNFKVEAHRIASKDYKGAAGMISVKDAQGVLYFRGKASRAYHEEDGDYYTPDHRDIYFNRKGIPFVKSVDGKLLLNIDGLKECVSSDSCKTEGYREDWWNYSLEPYQDSGAEAQEWTELVWFHQNNLKISKGILASKAKASDKAVRREVVLNEVEYLSTEAKAEFQKGAIQNSYILQQGAIELLEVIADVSISLSPAGWAKDAYELVSGTSLVDGHVLSTTERVFAGVGAISPALGPLGYAGLRMISRGGRVVSEAKFFGKLVKLTERVILDVPRGVAKQEFSMAALKVKATVLWENPRIFRIGTRGKSETGIKAQFWALEHPKNPGYDRSYGIPPENFKNADFIEVGRVKPGTSFVTRKALPAERNPGGAIEIVVPEGAVIIEGHYSL